MPAKAEVESDFGTASPEKAATLSLAKVNRVDSLGDQAVASLRGALRRGALLPGQRLTLEEDLATIDGIGPAQDLHQRRLARSVFADKDMDGAGANLEVHSIKSKHAGKCLDDVTHLENEVIALRRMSACAVSKTRRSHGRRHVCSSQVPPSGASFR